MRDQITRINQGQGTLGKLINDPSYAEEMKKALVSMNRILNRAGEMRLHVALGLQEMNAYSGSRTTFEVTIWPRPDRFYRLGMAADPRGRITQTSIVTNYGGTVNGPITTTTIEQGGFMLTALVGKRLSPIADIGIGLIYGDGAAIVNFNLGPEENREMFQFRSDLYFRPKTESNGNWTASPDARMQLILQPISIVYLNVGVEGFRKANGTFSSIFGAGIRFDDEDIRLLFSFL
jgi:phospholipid/cholesterol/gamma-HCH transport system substrate-binding protein